jgi:hypothetical protein
MCDPNVPQSDDAELLKALERGAEPYWMQDIRLAQARIQAERARLRAARSGGEADDGSAEL